VVAYDDEQIEMLDPHWLFAHHIESDHSAGAQPICLLTGPEAGWMATFLRPALERAGYRVATALRSGEAAALTLAMDDDPDPPAIGAPVLRLRRDRQAGRADTIFRYDRDGLQEALAAHAVGAKR
ncbi:MAG: chemotaxis protein CheA, partial [Sphingomonas sp.]